MLVTVGYLFLSLYQRIFGGIEDEKEEPEKDPIPPPSDASSDDMTLFRSIAQHIKTASIVLRVGVTESPRVSPVTTRISSLLDDSRAGWMETPLHVADNAQILALAPKLHVNLRSWTSFLDQQDYPELPVPSPDVEEHCYVVLEALSPREPETLLQRHLDVPPQNRTKVSDFARPIAWQSGEPYGIMAECSLDGLTQLCQSAIDGTLILDDMLQLNMIATVDVEGHAVNLLRTNSRANDLFPPVTPSPLPSPLSPPHSSLSFHAQAETTSTTSAIDSEEVGEQQQKSSQQPQQQPSSQQHQLQQSLQKQQQQPLPLLSLSLPAQQQQQAEQGTLLESNNKAEIVVKQSDEEEDNKIQQHDAYGSNESLASDPSDMFSYEQEDDGGEDMYMDHGEENGGEALSPSIEEIAPEIFTPARRKENLRMKPPNILLYCGKKDSERLFNSCKSTFEQIVNGDKYIIYHLKHDLVNTTPWADNASLLLVCSDKVYDGVDQAFLRYFLSGGSVMSFTSALDSLIVPTQADSKGPGVLTLRYHSPRMQHTGSGVTVICGRYVYPGAVAVREDVSVRVLGTDASSGKAVMLEAVQEETGGVAILSQVNLDKDALEMGLNPQLFAMLKKANPARFEILQDLLQRLGLDCSKHESLPLTPCFLYSNQQSVLQSLLTSVRPRLMEGGVLKSRNMTLHFCDTLAAAHNVTSEADRVAVVTDTATSRAEGHGFDFQEYSQHLHTTRLGNLVMYTEVAATTMTFFDGLMFSVPKDVGLIAIATRQTSGKGRGGNTWLSPPGCAMFSLHISLSLHSTLGQRAGYMQHIASLAIVEAINGMNGYQDIDLRLKWPNDIYFGRNIKLGGVIVNSSFMGDSIHANIGCGLNVNNTDPTACINDLVEQYNRQHPTASLPTLSTEQVIAATVTRIEQLIDMFQTQGKQAFLERYYSYWLHGDNTTVGIVSDSGDQQTAVIQGLDDHGYLEVKTTDTGKTFSVHPDGNSFDMMKNLIVPK